MMTNSIARTEWPYFQKLLQYHKFEYEPLSNDSNLWSGGLQKIKGFSDYNFLLDINLCFSSKPSNDVKDRTGQTLMPFKIQSNLWTLPTSKPQNIEECLDARVLDLISYGKKINLFWSGGIDSTAMLVAFLKRQETHSRLRVIHTINSRKENPYFFLLLAQYPKIELLEVGGDFYMKNILDGLFVHAGAGDNLLASIDQTWWENLGPAKGNQLWKDYLLQKNKSIDFINRCEEFFSRSGRDINTIVEARWWYYLICKFMHSHKSMLLQSSDQQMTSFFDFKLFEDYMYYNTDKIIPGSNYSSYKTFLKDYIFEFDKNKHYNQYKCKENSGQIMLYTIKKHILDDTRPIMWLSDGTRISVDSLPFLTELSYRNKYGNTLNYLFNQL